MREGRIVVSIHDDYHARFRVWDLSDAQFRAYRDALDGARYHRQLGASVASLDKVPAILRRLRKAGLGVGPRDMDPAVRRILQERCSTQDWLDRDAVKDRIARIEKRNGEKLYSYQPFGAMWLARRHGALLADEMGVGKTVQTIIAMPANASVVIVAPVACKGEWAAQIARWRPDLHVEIINGRKNFRWPKPGEVLVVNYDILPEIHDRDGVTGRVCEGFLPPKPCPGCKERMAIAGDVAAMAMTRTAHKASCKGFLEKEPCGGCHPSLELVPRGMVLIADEAQELKNEKSLRHRRFCAMADSVRRKDGYVWILTGTPLENEPNELWAVLRAGTIADEAFGSRQRFERVFRVRNQEGGGYQWGMPGAEIREHLKRVMLRRLKSDVLDLPKKQYRPYAVQLDQGTYQRIEEFLHGSGKSVEEIVDLLEREEIGFEWMSSVRAAIARAKIPAMLDIVKHYEDRQIPLVVFSVHRAPIDLLAKRKGWVVISGAERKHELKTKAKDEFQNGYVAGIGERFVVDGAGVKRRVDAAGKIIYPKGIALTIEAGGTGITLTRASHELFVDRAWNPQVNYQAEDRCHRIGQDAASVDITDLFSNHPLDARLTQILIRKTRLFEASINAAAERGPGTGTDEEDFLQQLREEREAIAAGYAVRRAAENDRERGAWEALHTMTFESPWDEKVAADLAEQADTIGLSNKQWSLAIVITRRAKQAGDQGLGAGGSETPPIGDTSQARTFDDVELTTETTRPSSLSEDLVHAPAPSPQPLAPLLSPQPPVLSLPAASLPASTPAPTAATLSALEKRRLAWQLRARRADRRS